MKNDNLIMEILKAAMVGLLFGAILAIAYFSGGTAQ